MNRYLCIILLCLFNLNITYSQDLLEVNGKPFFANGMNLAWINFANDLSGFNSTTFTAQVKKLAASGGNTMRWWLHVNGTSTPTFINDTVSGISTSAINNLKRALDTAHNYNVYLILCLWSFDMLQDNANIANWPRNKKLLEDSMATAAYIRNALKPMVEALKGHPAILCWEVFNEPEGMSSEFGWTPVRTSMKAIQAFTNRIAGAIHRFDSTAKVSNGTWNIKAQTDVNGMYNYYRDDRLIAAGGDSLGTLDFYMVHYYNEHFGTSESPFHHHKSYWELSKPLVIGEFPAKGMYGGQITVGIAPTEAFNYAYDNGYAGALSWTMTGHDGLGSLVETGPALEDLAFKHPDTIQIDIRQFNFSPRFIKRPNDVLTNQGGSYEYIISANDLIFDPDDSIVTFSITNVSNSNLLSVKQLNDSVFTFDISATLTGVAKFTIKAIDARGKSTSSYFVVYISPKNSDNLALYRKVTTSSEVDPTQIPYLTTDGNINTGWWGAISKYEWLTIELDEIKTFNTLKLLWGNSYGRKYYIQTSNDGFHWNTVMDVTNGTKGLNIHTFPSVTAKYIRIDCYGRSSNNGYILYEAELYNDTTTHINTIGTGLQKFNVYPNPANSFITLQMNPKPNQINEVLFYNQLGQFVQAIPLKFNTNTIDIQNLPPGIYLIQAKSGKTSYYTNFIKYYY